MSTNAALVRTYFDACNTAAADGIAACFCADAVVYDTNHRPVQGAAAIGAFWERVRSSWSTVRWHIDTLVDGGDTVAIEWTMSGVKDDVPTVIRGSEHYDFRDGRIIELRQYWTSGREGAPEGLVGFPYESDERFTTRGTA